MDIQELLRAVSLLPKDILEALVVELIVNEKISYDAVSSGYIKYLKKLKEIQNENFTNLQVRVTRAYCGYKKDYEKNINECMRYLHEKGRVNLSAKDKKKIGID